MRQPIVCVLGHVDHGKTLLLDRIRGTAVALEEPGAITQYISASSISIDAIKRICAPVEKIFRGELKIPGLLFIDTPGHLAFANLRRRGGSIADLAVLVIDVTQGVQSQTVESIQILKEYRTPFIVAANKIDLIQGWRAFAGETFTKSLSLQRENVKKALDEKIYAIVGSLSQYGFSSERFDRVRDFTKEVAIVPMSAKSGEGIPELLLLLAGLSQKYLAARLATEMGPGRGGILEVKFTKELGTTLDVVLYDGSVRKGDLLVFGTATGAKTTKIRGLIIPKNGKFEHVNEVVAAAGVKILGSGLEGALPGSSVIVTRTTEQEKAAAKEIESELQKIMFKTEKIGVILKADTLGSLEGVTCLLESSAIPVRRAGIGAVARHDVAEASSVREKDRYLGAIFAFNVEISPKIAAEASAKKIGLISSNIIYELVDKFKEWQAAEKLREKEEVLAALVWPAKIKILPGYVFRVSKPAIFGIEVQIGIIRPGYELMKTDGTYVGEIKSIQSEKVSLAKAEQGQQVAIAVEGPIFGRHIFEGDVLLTIVPKGHATSWKEKFATQLSKDEAELLEKIRKLARI